MSARLGNPTTQNVASGAVTAAGRVLTIAQWSGLSSVLATWVATATVGNRTVQALIKDAGGNIYLRIPAAAAITAGQTVNLSFGAGFTIQNFTGPPIVMTGPLPIDMPLSPNSTITIVDTSNIDATDTCSINAALTT